MGSEQSAQHAESLGSLQSMGFTHEQAAVALQASNGDLNRAVALLLEQAEAQPARPPRPGPSPTRAVAMAEEEATLLRVMNESRLEATAAAASRPSQPAPQSHAAAAAEARKHAAQSRGAPGVRPALAPEPEPTPKPTPARRAPPLAPARSLPVAGGAGGGTAEERVQRCAAALAGRSQAVDILIVSLQRAIDHPNDEKYRRVNPSNPVFAKTVGATPGGVEFLYAVGFEPVHGHLVLQRRDPALLWLGKAALEAAKRSGSYQTSKEAVQIEAALAMSQQEYAACSRHTPHVTAYLTVDAPYPPRVPATRGRHITQVRE